jgi:hypothetical protein
MKACHLTDLIIARKYRWSGKANQQATHSHRYLIVGVYFC